MREIFGLVLFKIVSNTIEGQQMNNLIGDLQTETLVRNTGDITRFTDIFESTWADSAGNFRADLNIQENNGHYHLRWSNIRDNTGNQIATEYRATGRVINGELACGYIMVRI